MTDKDIDKAQVTEQELNKVVKSYDTTNEKTERRIYWCHNTIDKLSTELPYTGVDNRTGYMWTEDFPNKADLYNWFKGYCND